MSAVPAPAGWSYPPGYPLGEITAESLPELPLRQLLTIRRQNAAIVETLRQLPFLRHVTAQHVADRYGGMTRQAAWLLLQRAKSNEVPQCGARHTLIQQSAQQPTPPTQARTA